jgi:quercetin dioxygenase-like cupin family protein
MKFKVIRYGDVTSTVYYLNKGDMIAKHRHTVNHGTVVLEGATVVEIFDGRAPIFMGPETDLLDLPANIDHEVLAVTDGTIIVHPTVGSMPPADGVMTPAKGRGGVLMEDGTINYENP